MLAFRKKMLKERMGVSGDSPKSVKDLKDGKTNGASEGSSALQSEDEVDERTPFLASARRKQSKGVNGKNGRAIAM